MCVRERQREIEIKAGRGGGGWRTQWVASTLSGRRSLELRSSDLGSPDLIERGWSEVEESRALQGTGEVEDAVGAEPVAKPTMTARTQRRRSVRTQNLAFL